MLEPFEGRCELGFEVWKLRLLSEPGPVGACYHRPIRIEIADEGRQYPQMVTMKNVGLEALDGSFDHDFEGVAGPVFGSDAPR